MIKRNYKTLFNRTVLAMYHQQAKKKDYQERDAVLSK